MKYSKWKKDTQPGVLIKYIEDKLTITEDGRISRPLLLEFEIDALLSKVEHSYRISREILYDYFQKAIYESFQNKTSKSEELILTIFDDKCRQLNKTKKQFVLVTSIGLKTAKLPKRRKVLDCHISFYKSIPKKYVNSREKLVHIHNYLNLQEDESYTIACVSICAPNPTEAYDKGMKALDLLRGVWQLNFKKNINFLASGPEKYFTNSIMKIGSIHSLHTFNGCLATETIWYEESKLKKEPVKLRDINKFEIQCTRVLKKIKNSSFRRHLEESLIFYIQSVDKDEHEYRFLKLWTLLEFLVKSDSTKELSNKLSFFYKDRRVTKEVIMSLRDERNTNSHKGKPIVNIEMKNYLMVSIFEETYKFLLNNPFGMKSLTEILNLLQHTTERSEVKNRLKLLKKVDLFIDKK